MNGKQCFRYIILALVVTTMMGCGPGYRSVKMNGVEKVTYVDDKGNKRLIYELADDGTLTIHDQNDPRAKEMLAKQEAKRKAEQAKRERIEKAKLAKKRTHDDPIFVAMPRTELSDDLAQAEKPKGAFYDMFLKEFQGDKVIKMHKEANNQQSFNLRSMDSFKPDGPEAPGADVTVVTKAYFEQKYGVSKSSHKAMEVSVLVMEATISSIYTDKVQTIKEFDHILKNQQLMKTFAEKVKAAVKNEMGPNIPADRI